MLASFGAGFTLGLRAGRLKFTCPHRFEFRDDHYSWDGLFDYINDYGFIGSFGGPSRQLGRLRSGARRSVRGHDHSGTGCESCPKREHRVNRDARVLIMVALQDTHADCRVLAQCCVNGARASGWSWR